MSSPVRPGWFRTGWWRRPRCPGALAQAVARSCWASDVLSGFQEMLLGATVYPLSNPIFWSVFAGAAMVRMSSLASAFAVSGDVWILLFEVTLSGPGIHEMLGSAPVCPLSNHTGEPWSLIVGPAIVPEPSPAVFHRHLRMLCWWRRSLAIARRPFFFVVCSCLWSTCRVWM